MLQADASGRFTTACGVLSAVLIVVGLLPQLWEVYKYKAGELQLRVGSKYIELTSCPTFSHRE